MAGHSKWANIQHRKGRQDKLRSKLFSKLAKEITASLSIPTIGIGAGAATDAQVLVWTDMAGLTAKPPKLAKAYRNLRQELLDAAKEYADEVRTGAFPTEAQTFH